MTESPDPDAEPDKWARRRAARRARGARPSAFLRPESRSETGIRARGCSVVVSPSAAGDQHLRIRAGDEEVVCTLSSYSDRVATGHAEPYLVVHIRPHGVAELGRLQEGTYDFTVETGQDWTDETRSFRVSTGKRRSLRPVSLFGQAEVTLTAYPAPGGNLPLGDV